METNPEESMAPRPSWWTRNWKWALPAGCVGLLSCGCLSFVVLGLGTMGAGLMGMASAGPTDDALKTALGDPEVQRALGTPIKPELMRQVSIQSVNGRTHATLAIPLDGTQADGMLRVEADKTDGEWVYSRLEVTVPGQADINLLSGGGAPPPEPALPPGTPEPDEDAHPESPDDSGDEDAQGKGDEHDINL
ncbi:cytochrome c oxidase assembly factor Coa1 family protein [Myxococcaceae bacterium GXIMD 01537]